MIARMEISIIFFTFINGRHECVMFVTGLREWFAQRDGTHVLPPVPRMSKSDTGKLSRRDTPHKVASLPEIPSAGISMYDESEPDLHNYSDPEVSFIVQGFILLQYPIVFM